MYLACLALTQNNVFEGNSRLFHKDSGVGWQNEGSEDAWWAAFAPFMVAM